MSIVRTIHNKENPFVMINRKALWDKGLSLEAVGLWARLLSRPDDWHINVEELSKSCNCSKSRIYRILNELIQHGYAFREQTRIDGKKKNQFGAFETYVFEFKMTQEQIKKMFPQRDFPDAELPDAENRHTTNTNITKKDSKILPPLPSPPKHEPPSKKSLRSEEEEIDPYEILKDCPLTQKERIRLTKSYSKEQVTKAISVSKKQKVKKSFMGLMLAILKNPEDWPGMIQDEDVNFEQNLAFKYNERLKKMYPKLYSENKKLIKNNVVKLVMSTGVEQISLASSYAQSDIHSAELFLR